MDVMDLDAYFSKRNLRILATKDFRLRNSIGRDGVPFIVRYYKKFGTYDTLNLLQKEPIPLEGISWPNEDGNNLMMDILRPEKAYSCDPVCVLLKSMLPQIEVGYANKRGETLLHILCGSPGHSNGAKLILDILARDDANVRQLNKDKSSALLIFCRASKGQIPLKTEIILKFLTRRDCPLNIPNGHMDVPLTWLLANQDEENSLRLLEAGASVDFVNTNLTTPLILACASGLEKAAFAILEKGGLPAQVDVNKKNALFYAKRQKLTNVIEALEKIEKK